jgi:molecular chaperone DnaK
MAADNTQLGLFKLDGIPPAPRGIPQIEVTFDIDANGIVHVTAKDKGTGKEQSIRITAPDKLSEEDIEKMVKEAEKYAEEDKNKKEMAESKNKADTLVYSTEKALADYGDKISESDKKTIETKVGELKELLKKSDVTKEEMDKVSDELTKASHKLAEEVYKASTQQQQQQQAQAGPQPGAEGPQAQEGPQQEAKPKDEDVVDAEYKEEDDKNKQG